MSYATIRIKEHRYFSKTLHPILSRPLKSGDEFEVVILSDLRATYTDYLKQTTLLVPDWFDIISKEVAATTICTCTSATLFDFGCQCGAFQKEAKQ